MQEVKTVYWVEAHTGWGKHDGEEGHTFSTQHWLRMTPPAEAWRTDFDGSWSHDVTDEHGHLHTASTWKMCHFHPHSRPYDPEDLLRQVFFPLPVHNPSSEVSSTTKRPRTEWQNEQVEIKGQSLVRWYRDYVQDNFHVTQTIWTESETHRIVRKERRETDLLTGKPASIVICDRYTYNAELPAGTFEMPSDKPLVTPDYQNIMPEVWDALSASEQQAVQETINRSDAGWRSADFAAFASAWEFDFVSLVPHVAEWQERVQQQTGLWSRWTSVVKAANTQNFVPITVTTHTFRWGPEKRKVLRVKVKLDVAWKVGATGWDGGAEFYLRRKGHGYRIVHWECPWEEIRDALTADRENASA